MGEARPPEVVGDLHGLLAVVVPPTAHDSNPRVGADAFAVGRVDRLADSDARNAPILYPNLVAPAGRPRVGLAHDGASDFEGWRVFSLRPSGDAPDCLVQVDRQTKQLEDCEGTVFDPAQLPDAERVVVRIDKDGTLSLDLQPGT